MGLLGTAAQGLLRAARPEGEYDISEVPEVVYWLRMLLGLVAGLVCGVAGWQGLLPFAGFFAATLVGAGMWLKYQEIDSSEFPEDKPIAMEGLVPSIFFFMLCWVTSYSLVHF